MFLLPPVVMVDWAKKVDAGESMLPASELIGPIERYRHAVAPFVHGTSGLVKAISEAGATVTEATASFWEAWGVRNLFTVAARQVASNARTLAGNAAVVELMNDPRIKKPGWEIDNIKIGKIDATVKHEDEVIEGFERYDPFMRVIRFIAYAPDGSRIVPQGDPIFIPAPNSGHPPEYVDDTVKALLESGRDVRVIACRDAMDIPVAAGKFDLNSYAAGMARIFAAYEGKFHVLPICQPGPAVAIALAMMAEAKARGANITLPDDRAIAWIANPMDVEVNPKEVNLFATTKIIEWFDKFARAKVPTGLGYKGEGREIYYGLGQIVAFMMRDPESHWDTLKKFGKAVADRNMPFVEKIKYFFGRRFLVPQSLPYELYRQTVKDIFIENRLAKGEFRFTGEVCGVKFNDHPVDLGKIKNMNFLCLQGEIDDITPIGQCGKETMMRMFKGITNIVEVIIKSAGHTGAFRGGSFRKTGLPAALKIFATHDSPSSPRGVSLQKPVPGYGFGQAA
jgi:poly(3-hydroxybutyrate) depolymerase